MLRTTNIPLLVIVLLFPIFAQTPAPIYRVPADYSYFTAENKEMPSYPPGALSNNIGGDVILVLDYSTEGSVETVQGVRGNPVLVKAGVEAVRNWKFRPIKEKGQKARGVTYVGFDFDLATKTVTSSLPFGTWEPLPVPAATATPADVPKLPTRVRISSGVAARNKISGPNPIYPEDAKHNRIQGDVQLRAIISRDGNISLLEVIKAPSTDLAIASVEAVKHWLYKPYTLNGDPIEVETPITVTYTLCC